MTYNKRSVLVAIALTAISVYLTLYTWRAHIVAETYMKIQVAALSHGKQEVAGLYFLGQENLVCFKFSPISARLTCSSIIT